MTTLKDELEKTASKLRAAIDRKDEEMIAFFLDAIILYVPPDVATVVAVLKNQQLLQVMYDRYY
jgi:hypothetical protein